MSPPRRSHRTIVAAMLLMTATTAGAGDWRMSGSVGVESRTFWESAAHADQLDAVQLSLQVAPEWRFTSAGREHRLVLAPYLRLDAEDDERTHFDVREAYWLRVGRDWELTLGVRRVFWGVAESRHLVDVVNQVDAVEGVDEEDRLGQPMIGLTLLRSWGALDLHVLPGFRPRTAAGTRGRLRPPLRAEPGADRWDEVSYAVRWSHAVGDLDLGVHWFHGTDREPRLVPSPDGVALRPTHARIDQLGIDAQLTRGAWLWKLEGIWRGGAQHSFLAAVAGFEWTSHGVGDTAADLGLLLELHRDGRDPSRAAPTLHDDDVFLGTRLALNDTQDTSLVAGVLFDPDTHAKLIVLEAERRVGDAFTVEVELRVFADAADDPAVAALARDDHLTVAWSWHF